MTARKRLEIRGFDEREAALMARKLLDFHTRTERAALLFPETALPNEAEVEKLLQRLENGEPLPHLLGFAPFWDDDFEVSSATLIPRPETELLVETVWRRLEHRKNPRICDLGAGTGAIAVTLARLFAKADNPAQIYALELSEAAREIAERNAKRLGAPIEILKGAPDWFSPLETLEVGKRAKFAALVSNPPYIPSAQIEELATGVREFEPRLALDGGADGLNPYRIFASKGREFLENDGFFAVELGAGQWDEIAEMFRENGWRVEPPMHDLAGIARVLVASF